MGLANSLCDWCGKENEVVCASQTEGDKYVCLDCAVWESLFLLEEESSSSVSSSSEPSSVSGGGTTADWKIDRSKLKRAPKQIPIAELNQKRKFHFDED